MDVVVWLLWLAAAVAVASLLLKMSRRALLLDVLYILSLAVVVYVATLVR